MQVSASRVVAFVVTPILTAATMVGTGWLERHFPGLPPLDATQLVALEITSGAAVGAAALKWLHGLSLWERAVHVVAPVAKVAEGIVSVAVPGGTAAVAADAEKAAEAEAKKVAEAFAELTPAGSAFPPAPVPEPAPAPAAVATVTPPAAASPTPPAAA